MRGPSLMVGARQGADSRDVQRPGVRRRPERCRRRNFQHGSAFHRMVTACHRTCGDVRWLGRAARPVSGWKSLLMRRGLPPSGWSAKGQVSVVATPAMEWRPHATPRSGRAHCKRRDRPAIVGAGYVSPRSWPGVAGGGRRIGMRGCGRSAWHPPSWSGLAGRGSVAHCGGGGLALPATVPRCAPRSTGRSCR